MIRQHLLKRKVTREMNELDELVLTSTNDLYTPTEDALLAGWIRAVLASLDKGE